MKEQFQIISSTSQKHIWLLKLQLNFEESEMEKEFSETGRQEEDRGRKSMKSDNRFRETEVARVISSL